VKAASDARNVKWFEIDQLPQLAFDHQVIFETAINRLRAKVRYQPIGFELLPDEFTLPQLQRLYETILGMELNKRNFRTRILKMGILKEVGRQQGVSHRPARIYSFDKEKYEAFVKEKAEHLVKRGVDFEV
jgi:8-oxo-dGTP diphosphatase